MVGVTISIMWLNATLMLETVVLMLTHNFVQSVTAMKMVLNWIEISIETYYHIIKLFQVGQQYLLLQSEWRVYWLEFTRNIRLSNHFYYSHKVKIIKMSNNLKHNEIGSILCAQCLFSKVETSSFRTVGCSSNEMCFFKCFKCEIAVFQFRWWERINVASHLLISFYDYQLMLVLFRMLFWRSLINIIL